MNMPKNYGYAAQRSRITVVRDFGVIYCPPTAKLIRSSNAQF